jgi:hypothetical protein
MFAGGAVLAAALLVGGAVQAAPAPKARPHATRTQAKLTTAQAEAVAVKKFAGKVVGKTKLENEEGTWQYGVMVQSGKTLREVMVNAKTGKIDTVEVTNAATESREAKAEAAKAKPAPKAAATPKSAKATARTRHGTK